MTDKHQMTEEELEILLQERAAKVPDVPDHLLSRIVADADQVAMSRPRKTVWTLLSKWNLGSWFQIARVASLGAFAVIGVWAGYAPPAGLADFPPLAQEEYELYDFLPTIDSLIEEG